MNHKPYKNLTNSKKEQIVTMFDHIAKTYDRLNGLITFGMDKVWRRSVATMILAKNPTSILDVATGTGALAIDLATRSSVEVVGIDISQEMLTIGKEKIRSLGLDKTIRMELDDAESLSFKSDRFDAVTIGFGVRNFEDLNQGLREVNRVLKSGGQLVILETSVPTYFPFKQGYYLYTKWIIPLFGKLFARNKVAYEYLSTSANIFPHGERFNEILRKNGFKNTVSYPRMFGIVTIYSAFK